LQTLEELRQKNRRIQDSLNRIQEIAMAQEQLEQQRKDSGRSGLGSYSDMNGYSDDKQGMGGFAGGDTKKRRGVSSFTCIASAPLLMIF
jgi:septal ring factor EnvC (AmiA/AmiB activator)